MSDISKITLNGTEYNVKDANAQPTLVSGTNIKTINNESLLGSGNITIQGGSGGGETVIELTQAQYDALTAYSENTTYIITDADPINMDNYATTGTVNTISGQVSTLSGTVANKADKANVTATSSGYYFPYFNAQGIITGSTGPLYSRSVKLNGNSYNIARFNNSDMQGFYAPTSSGETNSILMSAGVNASPVWSSIKMQFISRSAYDAITTKDANTLYFIISEN